MRKVAVTDDPKAAFQRAMIFDSEGGSGVYVFLFRALEDGPCDADYLHEDVASAERHAAEELGSETLHWQPISDPRPDCQADWIAPVRAVRDAAGRVRFERLTEP